MNNYFILIFSAVVGGALLYTRIKDYQVMSKKRNDALTSKYKKYDYSLWVRVLYIVLIIAGIAGTIYGVMIKDADTIAIAMIIALMFIGELFIISHRMVLYYSDTHFIVNGKVTRYKSIKDFEEMKFFPLGFVRVVTMSDEKIPLSRKAYEIVREQRNNLKHK